MKRTCFKVQLAVILVCGLFAVATLSSCDKAKQLKNTTWEGDYEKDDDNEQGTIELSFSDSEVDITMKIGAGTVSQATTYRATASFTCEKKDISFGALKWKGTSTLENKDNDSGKWKGTLDKDVITLKNVLKGMTVKFKKSK